MNKELEEAVKIVQEIQETMEYITIKAKYKK